MSSVNLPTEPAGHRSSPDLPAPVITLRQIPLPEWSCGYSILLAHGPDQPTSWAPWVHLLVLCDCRSSLDMGSLHLLLASTFRRPSFPRSRNRPQIRDCPYLHRGMLSRSYSWCLGHAMASVDCVRYCARRYHFCRVRWNRGQHRLAVDAGEHRRCSRHSLRYDLRRPRVPSLGKFIYQWLQSCSMFEFST